MFHASLAIGARIWGSRYRQEAVLCAARSDLLLHTIILIYIQSSMILSRTLILPRQPCRRGKGMGLKAKNTCVTCPARFSLYHCRHTIDSGDWSDGHNCWHPGTNPLKQNDVYHCRQEACTQLDQ